LLENLGLVLALMSIEGDRHHESARGRLENAHAAHGLKSALRITPNDTREFERPHGCARRLVEKMLLTFEGCATAGAELLSIESVGGKEVHDDALTMGDMPGVLFSLCIMGVRDMRFLWSALDKIARNTM